MLDTKLKLQDPGKCTLLPLKSIKKGMMWKEIYLNLELSLVRRLPWVDTWEISWMESTVWEINEESYFFDKVRYGFRTNVRISFDVKM